MKKIKLIALIAALVVAIGGYQFLKEAGKPQETPRTAVVVAVADIPENTLITADMVMLQQVATEALLPGHLLQTEDAVGLVMSSDVYAGEQIISNRLVQVGTEVAKNDSLAYKVDDGMRAVTVSVGAASGLAYLIRPGNRVDVVMHYSYEKENDPEDEKPGMPVSEETSGEEPETETVLASRVLLQNVTVLAVDSVLNKDGQAEAYATVTLQLTPEDAVKLAHAEWTASIRLLLRSSLDQEISEELSETEVDMELLRGAEEEAEP